MDPLSIPPLWREGLFHPPLVHFPIAILTLIAFLEVVRFVTRTLAPRSALSDLLRPTIVTLLILGVPFTWLSIYTGELAHSEVNRMICDPSVTHEHAFWGWVTAYLFSAALLTGSLLYVPPLRRAVLVNQILSVLCTFLYTAVLFGGVGTLFYASHLGGSLVYQQAANVYVPTPECKEFE